MPQDPQPVPVAVVGTSLAGTGDGGLAPSPARLEAETPEGSPDLLVRVVSPLMAIAVRYINTFLVSFTGLLGAQSVGVKIFTATELHDVMAAAAWASIWVANMGLLKNLVTIFGKLEGKYPLATGSI